MAGGEDTVVKAERQLLEEMGHEVIPFYKNNKVIGEYGLLKKLRLIQKTTWSKEIYREFTKLLKDRQPDICHVHNFFPLISPAVYDACNEAKVPIVQTLHNYRLICTSGILVRKGEICEDCLAKSAYGSVKKKCYRNSYLQTYAVARMLEKHKTANTWSEKVSAYICLTDFAKQKFIAHGLPKDKLMVKSNFVEESTVQKNATQPYFIFVGRLDNSKGVDIFKLIHYQLRINIKIVGEGDLADELLGLSNIELLGKKSHSETLALIGNATALILPSIWYEGMPMTILEAFASKTLVIASNIGAMSTMITHKENGLLFENKSANALINNLNFALENEGKRDQMIHSAFKSFQQFYSKESNYKKLLEIYDSAINSSK